MENFYMTFCMRCVLLVCHVCTSAHMVSPHITQRQSRDIVRALTEYCHAGVTYMFVKKSCVLLMEM